MLDVKQKMVNKIPIRLWLLALIGILLFSFIISASNGQANISFFDVIIIYVYKISNGIFDLGIEKISSASMNIIWFVRTPRILLAIFVGIGLAMSGAVMQAVVQNPLADPYILGISSGATLGATFSILIGFGGIALLSQFGLTFGAFMGAVAASLAVLALSSIGGRMTSIKLVLSGAVIHALFNALSNFIVFFANDAEGIKSVTFWVMGSLTSASWSNIPLLAGVIILTIGFFSTQHRILNVMLLGDEAAITLGIELSFYRRLYMVLTSLLTGIIVSNSGMIGFVGLIVPHIVRGIFGSNYKQILPITIFIGALFLLWSDLLSRIIVLNVELPIGIITALVGAPLFIYIIVKKGYNFGGT